MLNSSLLLETTSFLFGLRALHCNNGRQMLTEFVLLMWRCFFGGFFWGVFFVFFFFQWKIFQRNSTLITSLNSNREKVESEKCMFSIYPLFLTILSNLTSPSLPSQFSWKTFLQNLWIILSPVKESVESEENDHVQWWHCHKQKTCKKRKKKKLWTPPIPHPKMKKPFNFFKYFFYIT